MIAGVASGVASAPRVLTSADIVREAAALVKR
jgi:hypothetical protein